MASPILSALLGDAETAALFSDEAQMATMLAFERALAEAEADAGLISEAAADAVARAVDAYAPDWDGLAAGLAQDGVVVPALIKQLRAGIAAPHAETLHFGATSQDVIDTALILQIAKFIPLIAGRLADLQTALEALSAQHGDKSLMAHTRMQRALPFTVADKLKTWIEPIVRHRAALAAIRRSLLVIQLGGPIGNRSSFDGRGDEVARFLAQKLDLGLAYPWQSGRDPLVAFASLLSLITGSLGKIGADVALMAQNEVAAITLSGGGTSSAMAHKSNPVNAEVLVSLARYNAGLVGALHQALIHENERSGAAWTLEWLTLPQIFVTTGASTRIALALANQISFP
jgi:3-carboxy-cis,cis-muconate cycloisomerase